MKIFIEWLANIFAGAYGLQTKILATLVAILLLLAVRIQYIVPRTIQLWDQI